MKNNFERVHGARDTNRKVLVVFALELRVLVLVLCLCVLGASAPCACAKACILCFCSMCLCLFFLCVRSVRPLRVLVCVFAPCLGACSFFVCA